MIPKIELEFPLDDKSENEVEFVTYNNTPDSGCCIYVYIRGDTAYEINLKNEGLQLTVKEYDGKTLFDESLEEKYWE